ncbi:MAG: FecR domain-containing protein [Planctomycetota bacterium]
MDCKQAQVLMTPHIMGYPEPSSNQYAQFEAHLAHCPECAAEYEQTKDTIAFISAHKAQFSAALAAVESEADRQTRIEQSWRCIEAKLDRIEAEERRRKWARIHRAAAVAACVMVAMTLLLRFSKSPESPISTPTQVASDFNIELLYDSGPVSVAPGQQLRTAPDQLQTLIINRNHRITMNANTSLAVYPYTQAGRSGCRIKLAGGQILAHVQPDTGPFLVATPHGKAIITGTVFDIDAAPSTTTLVVSEGLVHFQSPKGVVEVGAGRLSKIIGGAAPTTPVGCNAAEVMAWATGHELKTVLAKIHHDAGDYELTHLLSPAISGPVDLESIDYEAWVRNKRDWFKREFPWIFELQSALGEQGIELDYPRLLIETGNIRQFAYPAASPTRILSVEPDSLLKTAAGHGFNRARLLQNVPAARSAIENPRRQKELFTGLTGLHKWAENVNRALSADREPAPDILFYSLHAATYLANTKTLLWLAVNAGQVTVPPNDRDRLLAMLQSQVEAANSLVGNIIKLLWTSHNRPCEGYWELSKNVTDDITAIITAEKEISRYEQSK